jgi:alpha-tubulin suppressor-like RCC1 family protein
MDNLIHKCVDNYLVINYWFQLTYGEHYPIELVQFIIKLYFHLFRIKIKCGNYYTVLLFEKEIYAWGYNQYGQLGLGHNADTNSPQKLDLINVKKIICGGYHTIALTYSNEIYAWGDNQSGQLGLATSPKGAPGASQTRDMILI